MIKEGISWDNPYQLIHHLIHSLVGFCLPTPQPIRLSRHVRRVRSGDCTGEVWMLELTICFGGGALCSTIWVKRLLAVNLAKSRDLKSKADILLILGIWVWDSVVRTFNTDLKSAPLAPSLCILAWMDWMVDGSYLSSAAAYCFGTLGVFFGCFDFLSEPVRLCTDESNDTEPIGYCNDHFLCSNLTPGPFPVCCRNNPRCCLYHGDLCFGGHGCHQAGSVHTDDPMGYGPLRLVLVLLVILRPLRLLSFGLFLGLR